MANSSDELRRIHSLGRATEGKKYYQDDGKVFIGTDNGRLKLLEKSNSVLFKPVVELDVNNTQSAIEEVLNLFIKSRSKQTEVDFGSIAISEQIFTILDSDINVDKKIVAELAYDSPTNKDLDETEMDYLNIRCSAGDGFFKMFITSNDGSYLHDKFKINYTLI